MKKNLLIAVVSLALLAVAGCMSAMPAYEPYTGSDAVRIKMLGYDPAFFSGVDGRRIPGPWTKSRQITVAPGSHEIGWVIDSLAGGTHETGSFVEQCDLSGPGNYIFHVRKIGYGKVSTHLEKVE